MMPDLDPQIRSKVTKMPGVSVQVDHELCKGCKTCSKEGVCFAHAIHVIGKKAHITDECRGCGHCVSVCPQEAIKLDINMEVSIDTTIDEITPLVNVAD
jgi:TPP-dependent indolepyruvate ferredoxin oxidoreductase alpha subunit